jgi:hypothetical protein
VSPVGIRRAGTSVGALLVGALVAAVLTLAFAPGQAQARLQLGLQDPGFEAAAAPAQERAAYAAMHAVAGSVVRVAVLWATVAPGGKGMPAGFRPSDAGDPRYRWGALDTAVRSAATHHLQVIFQLLDAPTWAQGPGPVKPYVSPGAWDPNPTQVAAFLRAAAVRYGGSFPDPLKKGAKLPRVAYWEPWNEPNIPGYFSAPNPVTAYRTLLNRAYGVLKAIHTDNVVVLGGLAPVSPVPGAIPPLVFGADLMCLHRAGGGFRASRSCRQRTDFDVFAMHPYSFAATPTKHAYKQGDVLVGDMGEVGALVRTADRLRTTAQRIHHRLWVTEFAWPTNPPDSQIGDSEPLAARYVAYSMYEMWKSGASLVIWQTVLDVPGGTPAGGGLYRSSGKPKLTLRAFAFPVIASVNGGRGFVWGRAPVASRTRIIVQRPRGRGWENVAWLRTGTDGVFDAHFRASNNGLYRVHVLGGPTSLAYNSRSIPPERTHLTQ